MGGDGGSGAAGGPLYLQLAGTPLIVVRGAVPRAPRRNKASQLPDLIRQAGLQLLQAKPKDVTVAMARTSYCPDHSIFMPALAQIRDRVVIPCP